MIKKPIIIFISALIFSTLTACSIDMSQFLWSGKNTLASSIFEKDVAFSWNTNTGAIIDIHYPVSSQFPALERLFFDVFESRSKRFLLESKSASGDTIDSSYRINYQVISKGEWTTVIFDIQKSIGTSSTHARPAYTLSSATGRSYTIQDIVSPRFLYTLKKESDKQLGHNSWSTISADYSRFEDFYADGTNFVFPWLWSSEVKIPMDSFMFDRYLKNIDDTGIITPVSSTGATRKIVALTFDDGPSSKYTPLLLDILKKEGVKATFYVIGPNVEKYSDIIKREVSEWHEIGSHSYSHQVYTKLSDVMIQEDLYRADQAIYQVIGRYPRTIRHPYGAIDERVLRLSPLPSILWSIDTYDWKTRNVKKNIAAVQNARSGDIILFHDIHETSVQSIPEVIRTLKAKGFEFVTISELLDLSDDGVMAGKRCTKQGNCK